MAFFQKKAKTNLNMDVNGQAKLWVRLLSPVLGDALVLTNIQRLFKADLKQNFDVVLLCCILLIHILTTHANKKEDHPNSPAMLKISIGMNMLWLQIYCLQVNILYDHHLY